MSLQVLFGKKLKEIRLSKGLTQKELAQLTGLSTSFISSLERGIYAPSFAALDMIASSLGIPVRILFEFPER